MAIYGYWVMIFANIKSPLNTSKTLTFKRQVLPSGNMASLPTDNYNLLCVYVHII